MKNSILEDIKQYSRDDFENGSVNLHIHTTFSDGKADAADILRQAKEKGYKKIAICDHNTVGAHKLLKDDILIPAVEFDVQLEEGKPKCSDKFEKFELEIDKKICTRYLIYWQQDFKAFNSVQKHEINFGGMKI